MRCVVGPVVVVAARTSAEEPSHLQVEFVIVSEQARVGDSCIMPGLMTCLGERIADIEH